MRYRLVDTAFPIRDSLRPELRNKLLSNCLAEKAYNLLAKFCSSLLQNLYVCRSLKNPDSVWEIASLMDWAEEQEVGR